MSLSFIKQQTANAIKALFPLEYILKSRKNRYILSYHRVVPEEQANRYKMQRSMWISDQTFRKDIEWFSSLGDIVDLATILDTAKPNKRPLFSITFDDGWVDNYTHAFPILNQKNLPATVFLVTNAIDTGEIFWVEDFLYKIATLDKNAENTARKYLVSRLRTNESRGTTETTQLAETYAEQLKTVAETERKQALRDVYSALGLNTNPLKGHILNWDQIREMDLSNITFGSHTHNHVILQYADEQLISKELDTSRKIIKQRLGKETDYFCYPNARYRKDNADLLRSSGYRYAFRMHNIPLDADYDKYFIPRFLLNEYLCSNRNILLCRLLGIPAFR